MSKLKELGFNPQITKNFNLTELACHDGTGVPWDLVDNAIELCVNLQVLRDDFNADRKPGQPEIPVILSCGYRNPTYNAKTPGAVPESEHCDAQAGDIKVPGFTPKQVAARIEKLIAAKKMKQGGIGIYPTFTHYDTRGTRARW